MARICCPIKVSASPSARVLRAVFAPPHTARTPRPTCHQEAFHHELSCIGAGHCRRLPRSQQPHRPNVLDRAACLLLPKLGTEAAPCVQQVYLIAIADAFLAAALVKTAGGVVVRKTRVPVVVVVVVVVMVVVMVVVVVVVHRVAPCCIDKTEMHSPLALQADTVHSHVTPGCGRVCMCVRARARCRQCDSALLFLWPQLSPVSIALVKDWIKPGVVVDAMVHLVAEPRCKH